MTTKRTSTRKELPSSHGASPPYAPTLRAGGDCAPWGPRDHQQVLNEYSACFADWASSVLNLTAPTRPYTLIQQVGATAWACLRGPWCVLPAETPQRPPRNLQCSPSPEPQNTENVLTVFSVLTGWCVAPFQVQGEKLIRYTSLLRKAYLFNPIILSTFHSEQRIICHCPKRVNREPSSLHSAAELWALLPRPHPLLPPLSKDK